MIIPLLTGSSTSTVKRYWKDTAPFITGYDIFCTQVYNVAYGQVVYIGKDEEGNYVVNVKCNSNEILRYGNLSSVDVETAQFVKISDKIGIAKIYVHFEYVTRWKGLANFPVRVNNFCYYKQDPVDILKGTYVIESNVELDKDATAGVPEVSYIAGDQSYEFMRKK